jgi:hypothetical protein
MSIGIDYGLGKANIDPATGIRYGVISQNSVFEAWIDSAEPWYAKPEELECPECETLWAASGQDWGDKVTCPECGNEFEVELGDLACDEPSGWTFEDGEYCLEDCLDSDIFVLKSPYYTFAQFCSPCVPGAGNLDNWVPDGVKCYCLGHDWFEERVAPYPVYRVSDGSIVEPEGTLIPAKEGA